MGKDKKFGTVDYNSKVGDYNVICDYSGFKVPASQTKMTWNGYRVYKDFWEPRQPQDFLPSPRDRQTVPESRPDTADTNPTFVGDNEVTHN